MTMSQQQTDRDSERSLIALGLKASAIFFLVYLLSLPVAQRMLSEGYLDGYYWEALPIYSPIVWVYDHSPGTVEDCIDWYSELLLNSTTISPYRTHGGVI